MLTYKDTENPTALKKEASQASALIKSRIEVRRITSATRREEKPRIPPPRRPWRHAKVACEGCLAERVRTARSLQIEDTR